MHPLPIWRHIWWSNVLCFWSYCSSCNLDKYFLKDCLLFQNISVPNSSVCFYYVVLRGLWWLVSLCTTSKALIINSLSPYSGIIRGPALVLQLSVCLSGAMMTCWNATMEPVSSTSLLSIYCHYYPGIMATNCENPVLLHPCIAF